MLKVKTVTVVTFLLAGGGVLASLLLPTPSETTAFIFHLYFGLAYTAVVLFLGASVLFMMGFDGFKAQLRHAYILMCIGFSLLGLSMFELPVLLNMGVLDDFIKNNSGLIALPFLSALIILLIGTVKLVRLFLIKNLLVQWWSLLTIIAVCCGLVIFLPHVSTSVPESTFDASNVANALITAILSINILHALQIRRVASSAYTNAMAWLSLAFSSMVVVALGGLIGRAVFGDDETFIITACTLIPLVPSGILLLRSAYAFNFITSDTTAAEGVVARNFFGKPLRRDAQSTISSIDIVVFAAQLVSNQQAIDDILDDLRMVTSHLGPDRKLSPNDADALMQVYLKIEDYLLTKEPVRAFTRDSLRQNIATALHLSDDTDQTFWGKIVHNPVPPVATPTAPLAPTVR